MVSDGSRNFNSDMKAAAMETGVMDTPSRKKGGRGRRSLSERLRFRPRAFSASTAGTGAGRLPKDSSNTTVVEPRDSVATSGESEASTMGASPILQRVPLPRETRSCSTSAVAAAAASGGAANTRRGLHRQREVLPGGHERGAASPAAATAPAAKGNNGGAGLRHGGRESGQIKVMFRRHEFSSTRGKGLGLTVSPAKDVGQTGTAVPRGARIEEAEGCVHGSPQQHPSAPLRPGDLLAEVNGQDVRRLPFSEVLRLLNAPTPHVITTTAPSTTTTTVGSMFGSSSNSGSPARPQPLHPGNVTKILVRGSLSSAPVGPRTPGSGNGQYTAPPSTNRSRAPAASTPPSPAALAPLTPLARPGSPLRLGSSTKMPRGIAPLLTDLRRKSWRRKLSRRWGGGGGGGGSKKERARDRINKDSKTCTGAVSFFSSTDVTPTNAHVSSFASKQPASMEPWGGDTPGEKPSRIHRTRSMINSTLGRISPRGMLSPWAAGALEAKEFNAIPAVPPPPATPQSPAAAPPSPAGASPSEAALDARPRSPISCTTIDNLAKLFPRESPSEQRDPTHLGGGAGAAVRRGSKLRYSLSLPQSNGWYGAEDEESEDEGSEEDYSVTRQLSRETMTSSSSAFFPSDSEDDFVKAGEENEDEEDEDEDEEEHEDEDEDEEEHHTRHLGRPFDRRNETNTTSAAGAGADNQLLFGPLTPPRNQNQEKGALRRKQSDVAEEPPMEQEEDEIVALSSYLAVAERGWPWTGQDVLWAEYVSLNGQHRWIRSESCRHALLLVPGTLYLLEFPKEAVTRYMSHGLSTRARGSWFVSVDASDLSHLSVPVTPKDPRSAAATTATVRSRGFPPNSSVFSNRFEAGSGMILHKRGRGGACAWVECRSPASRDALVDVLSSWAQHAGANGKSKDKHKSKHQGAPPLKVELASLAQLSAETFGGGRRGRKMPTLTDERQSCPLW
ncbi:unnamed protein product [Scytosiphon promiscuus]